MGDERPCDKPDRVLLEELGGGGAWKPSRALSQAGRALSIVVVFTSTR